MSKQKAIELVNKFKLPIGKNYQLDDAFAKKCALISCDESIDALCMLGQAIIHNERVEAIEYFQLLKEEIEKL